MRLISEPPLQRSCWTGYASANERPERRSKEPESRLRNPIFFSRVPSRDATTTRRPSNRTTSVLHGAASWRVQRVGQVPESGVSRTRRCPTESVCRCTTSAGRQPESMGMSAGTPSDIPTVHGLTTREHPSTFNKRRCGTPRSQNVYGNALMESKREANTAVVNKILRSS